MQRCQLLKLIVLQNKNVVLPTENFNTPMGTCF